MSDNERPITIVVAGYSGVGKSTIIKRLAKKLPGSVIRGGDKYLLPFVASSKRNFILSIKALRNVEQVDISKEFLTKGTIFISNKFNKLKFKKKVRFVIYDYLMIQDTDKWNEADIRIKVDADEEKRAEKLANRFSLDTLLSKNRKKMARIRDLAMEESMSNIKSVDFTIFNPYDKEVLKKVDEIAEKILYDKGSRVLSSDKFIRK